MVWIDNAPMHYLAIYGTFIAEGAIMLMLIIPRWRHLGICAGICFHSLLALSGYAMYPAFSTLSIVLHILFITPAAALHIVQSESWKYYTRRVKSVLGVLFLICFLVLNALFALLRDYNEVALIWLVLVAWPLAIIMLKGQFIGPEHRQGRYFWSPLVWLNALAVLFFLSSASPYFGLKTAQSMNMFANLRLEGGISNHLVFTAAPGPFTYLENLVQIDAVQNAPQLEWLAEQDHMALVQYHFLSILTDLGPDAQVAYSIGDVDYPLTPVARILEQDSDILHREWVRKFFHFRMVDLRRPLPCEGF